MVLPVRPENLLRAERLPLPSGAELITFFETLPDRQDFPLLAVLKDNLNDSDPSNDRIRQVWVFTYCQPSIWQRMAGGVPFFTIAQGSTGNWERSLRAGDGLGRSVARHVGPAWLSPACRARC